MPTAKAHGRKRGHGGARVSRNRGDVLLACRRGRTISARQPLCMMARMATEVRNNPRVQSPHREIAVASAVFALALIVRLLNLMFIADNPYFTAPIMDEEYHHLWAIDILRGRAAEYLPFYRAPGYPYLLAGAYGLAGEQVLVGRVLSAILGALAVIATFAVGGIHSRTYCGGNRGNRPCILPDCPLLRRHARWCLGRNALSRN